MLRRFLKNEYFLMKPDDGEGGAGGSSEAGKSQGENDLGLQNDKDGQAGKKSSAYDEGREDLDNSKWDDKTKKYIEDLRKENARYRTDAKTSKTQFDGLNDRFGKLEGGLKQALGLEDEEITLEDQVSGLTNVNQNLEFKLAVRDIADEVGISGKDACGYFEYLVEQESGKLKDGEEISEERMDELISSVLKIHGNDKSSSTSIKGEGEGGRNPKPDGKTDVTLEEFSSMGTLQKGELFGKNPTLYNSLMKQARDKNLI